MNRVIDQIIIEDNEIELIEPGEARENQLILAPMSQVLDMNSVYRQLMFYYEAGIEQLTSKLQILNKEFALCNDRNPIENIKSRVKSMDSIMEKMQRRGLELSIDNLVHNIKDVAGIRVICPFISDVYYIAEILSGQSDIEVVQIKDYIKEPKENGYRSLHMLVMVDVNFSDQKKKVPVEIQLRTIAMNCWASLEHQLRYKKEHDFTKEMMEQLKNCADQLAQTDMQMQNLSSKVFKNRFQNDEMWNGEQE